MIEQELKAVAISVGRVPAEWDRAAAAAALLAGRARYLPWSDRAASFDEFFWAEANRRLATDDVTAIVNRQAGRLARPAEVGTYYAGSAAPSWRRHCCSSTSHWASTTRARH